MAASSSGSGFCGPASGTKRRSSSHRLTAYFTVTVVDCFVDITAYDGSSVPSWNYAVEVGLRLDWLPVKMLLMGSRSQHEQQMARVIPLASPAVGAPLREWAEFYARLGWRVFPLGPRSKVPAIPCWSSVSSAQVRNVCRNA